MSKLAKILGGVGIFIIVVFAGGIGKIVGKFTSERFFEGKKESEIDAVLVQAASRINKNLPMMVDSATRLDSTVGFNKQFRYHYTMINYPAEELDPKGFADIMRPQLIKKVCTTMESFMNNGVSVTYAYYGKNGKQFTTITVQPSQCKSS